MATLRFAVADDDAGSRLDRALAARPEIGTRSLAERLLVDGAVTVDGAARQKSHRLEPGSVVVVELPEAAAGLVAEPVTVGIAYEDEHLVVVDKPAGIDDASRRGNARRHARSAARHARAQPGATIRIDPGSCTGSTATRPASSSSRDAQAAFDALQEAIRRREVERRYLALVKGRPRSRSGRIDAPIGRDRRDPTKRSLDTEEPREAITRFEVVETLPEHALLDVTARDGEDAPDPRSSRRDRPAGLGRRHVRREGRPRPRSPVPARAPSPVRPSGHGRGDRRRIAASGRSRAPRSSERALPCDRLCHKAATARLSNGFSSFDPATSRGGGAVALCAVPPGPSVQAPPNQPERG